MEGRAASSSLGICFVCPGSQARGVFGTSMKLFNAELRPLSLPARGRHLGVFKLPLFYLQQSCVKPALAGYARRLGSGTVSIRMPIGQEGGWPARSRSTLPASVLP